MIPDADRIEHVLSAIQRIKGFVVGMDENAFRANPTVQDAIAYNITIIGEAVRCVSDETKSAHPEVPWKQIRAMRNILIHDYLRTDVDALWNVVQNDLDNLVRMLESVKAAIVPTPLWTNKRNRNNQNESPAGDRRASCLWLGVSLD